jgi:hypothetical protein
MVVSPGAACAELARQSAAATAPRIAAERITESMGRLEERVATVW